MSSTPLFSDRINAGTLLADSIIEELDKLKATGITAQPIVYALPRGGIPVAVPIARRLNCPLDIVVAKKITKPDNPELAMGAVTADGQVIWLDAKPFRKQQQNLRLEAMFQAQQKAQEQHGEFAASCPQLSAEGAIALIVDDGIATGMTMAVAVQALRTQKPAQIWICAPVAPAELMEWLNKWCDRVIVLDTPHPFQSVSRFYYEFPQVETSVALAYLQEHNQLISSQAPTPDSSSS